MWVVWWNCCDGVMSSMLKLCGFVGLLDDFGWPVNISLRMGVLKAQDGVVVGVVCPLPS